LLTSRWSLLDPSVRARIRAALRHRARRVAAAASYRIKGLGLCLQLMRRPSAGDDGAPRHGRHILLVDDLLPDPLFGAGYPRAFAIVRSLVAAGYAVEHYPMHATRSERDRMAKLFKGAVRFHEGAGAHGLRRLLWQEGSRFDALIVSRPTPMAALVKAHWRPRKGPGVVYDAEAVLAPREQRRRKLFGAPWTENKYRAALAAELRLARGANAVTAVGDFDAELIRSMLDVPVFVLPHSVDIRLSAPGSTERSDLLFVGRMTGGPIESPNVDSVLWFVEEVMPRLDQLIGSDYRLHLVGRVEASDVEALASPRILLHGIVDDIQSLYDQCRLFVAPTRYAAGIPLKVVEAMGQGIPCVVTRLLAEQLGVDDQALAIGADADGFAEECARLYNADEDWSSTQRAAFAYVARTVSPAAFDRTLVQLIDQVGRHVDERSAA